MSRIFLAFAIVFGLSFVSMGMVGCSETAAVNTQAPKDGGAPPVEEGLSTMKQGVEDE